MAIKELTSGGTGQVLAYEFYFNNELDLINENPVTFFVCVDFFSESRRRYMGVYHSFKNSDIEDKAGYGFYGMNPDRSLHIEGVAVLYVHLGYMDGNIEECDWSFEKMKIIKTHKVFSFSPDPNEYNIEPIEGYKYTGPGRWHLTPAFVDGVEDENAVYITKSPEIGGHIDIHVHLQSNHCAPGPLVWEKAGWIDLDVSTMDTFAPLVKSEFGSIANRPTDEITKVAMRHLDLTLKKSSYACYDSMPLKGINCVGMDMNFGHYFAYFGEPIYKIYYDTADGLTHRKPSDYDENPVQRIMYIPITKYNHKRFQGSVTKTLGLIVSAVSVILIPSFIKRLAAKFSGPTDKIGGNDFYEYKLKKVNADIYEDWEEQISNYHLAATENPFEVFSFFHLDPRRYYVGSPGSSDGFKSNLEDAFEKLLPCDELDGLHLEKFGASIGVKMYTALGYSPLDPRLTEVQNKVYLKCIENNMGIICHNSPEGFYTMDRIDYYDLITNDNMIGDGLYPEKSQYRTLTGFEEEKPNTDAKKIFWYNQNFTNVESWKKVIDKEEYKKLKLCLAHFTGVEHFNDTRSNGDLKKIGNYDPYDKNNSWTVDVFTGYDDLLNKLYKKEKRYPSFNVNVAELTKCKSDVESGAVLDETIANKTIDEFKTYKNIYDMMTTISKDNRLFFDISYVIMKKVHFNALLRFFVWAKIYKPIILERVIWGSDWPLMGAESEVSGGMLAFINRRIPIAERFKGSSLVSTASAVFSPLAPLLTAPFLYKIENKMDRYSVFEPYNNHNFHFYQEITKSIDWKYDDNGDKVFAHPELEGFCYKDLGDLGTELWTRFTFLNPIQYLGISGESSEKNLFDMVENNWEVLSDSDQFDFWKSAVKEIDIEIDASKDSFNEDKFQKFMKACLVEK